MRVERKQHKQTNGQREFSPGAPAPSSRRAVNDTQRPVYHISIVAEIVATHPQTLRMYERMGLLSPQRTRNNVRLYSEADVERVRRIQHLTQELGVNLAGVEVVFKLLEEMDRMRAEAASQLDAYRQEVERARNAATGSAANGNAATGQTRRARDGKNHTA